MPKGRKTKEWTDVSGDQSELKEPESKKSFGYEVGKIYANVKVVDIKPDVERSICFIETKKDSEGRVKLKGVYDRKGNIIGQQVDWDEGNVYMVTPSDFAYMVKIRPETGGILPNLG